MIHTLSSNLHTEQITMPFEIDARWAETHQVVAVLTGGTERLFLQMVQDKKLSLTEPIYLLASTQSNSLAASLEILSWIQQHQGQGRVITRPEDILETSESLSPEAPLYAIPHFGEGLRLGIIGRPSDWLIASGVDYEQVKRATGIELVDIPISEVQRIGVVEGGEAGAEAIYHRLKELVKKYRLQGLTLRCFDLLTSVCNTGCLALSRLNDEGIPAACEGDIPLLLTMMLVRHYTGQPGFQVNPARINADGRILFAHCTLPLKMTSTHSLTTHFESGIGVAIHGELPLGDYTLLKLSSDLQHLLIEDVTLVSNQYEPNLCRTQVWIQTSPEVARRLLSHPIANHHLLIQGHWAKAILRKK